MFQIGEFSRIAQVSGRQLRFYEQIGLLKPGHTDPQTGYRFYMAAQLPRLNRILALKELGFTLEEISPMLDREVSPEALRGMLALKRAQVSQVLQEEQVRLRMIESRIEQIDSGGHSEAPDLLIKSVPACHYLAVRSMLPDMAASVDLLTRILSEVPRVINPGRLGAPMVVMLFEMFEWEQMDVQMGFLLHSGQPISMTLSNGQTLSVSEMPPMQRAITTVRVGPIETAHATYQAIGRYIEAHHLRLAGPAREILLEPPGANSAGVTEVQVPVIAL